MIKVGLDDVDVDFIKFATVGTIEPVLFSVRYKLELLRKTLRAITNVDFSASEALHHWKQILVHHQYLAERLERPLDFSIAVIDYFTHVHSVMKSPMPIDQTVLAKLQRYANTDSLTGIYNRHFFHESIAKELARASRHQSRLSLLFFDIDGFKALNDTYGHQKGDQVLRHVATIIKSSLRTHDIACRYGGDEFICILPDTHYYFAMVIAERIRRMVAESTQALLPEQNQLSLTYGIATYPLDNDKPEELIRTCDVRLYEAKVAHQAQRKKTAVERRETPRIKTPGVYGVFFRTHLEKWDVNLLDIGPGGLSFLCPQSAESGIYQMQLFLQPPFSTAWVTVEPCSQQHLPSGEYRVGCRVNDINFV